LDEVARGFIGIIESQAGTSRMPTKDYGWENHRFANPRYRFAHVEIFNRDRFMVVHCCVFPRPDDPSPIFGFDVIAGESKVTGLFLDLSPTTLADQPPFMDWKPGGQRELPDWGRIFSRHVVACRPSSQDELRALCTAATSLLKWHIRRLGNESDGSWIMSGMQDRYCLQQRRNEHTTRAIRNILGEDLAREFITEVLFPTLRPTGTHRAHRYPALLSSHDVRVLSALASGIPEGGIAVECGSALGGSARVMLDANPALGHLHMIDPDYGTGADDLAREIDLYHEHAMPYHDEFGLYGYRGVREFAEGYIGNHPRVTMHGLASPYQLGWWEGQVDFVFEDSSHRNPQLRDNLEFWWDRLRPNGILAGHDYGVGCGDVDGTVRGMAESWGVHLNSDAAMWWVSKP